MAEHTSTCYYKAPSHWLCDCKVRTVANNSDCVTCLYIFTDVRCCLLLDVRCGHQTRLLVASGRSNYVHWFNVFLLVQLRKLTVWFRWHNCAVPCWGTKWKKLDQRPCRWEAHLFPHQLVQCNYVGRLQIPQRRFGRIRQLWTGTFCLSALELTHPEEPSLVSLVL